MDKRNWIELSQDADTGIESIRAHFQGHAYDPHWHDSFLVGVTEQGVQQFNCRRVRHFSTPGKVFMLEPGEIHDGHAPTEEGFTYSMLYLDPHWLERELHALFEHAPASSQPGFADTLSQDPGLATAIYQAFHALHEGDLRIVRQSAIDTLLGSLTCHLDWRKRQTFDPRLPLVAQVARDYLHTHVYEDIGLDDSATPRDEGLSAFGAATLQLVNPKVWMMAVAVVSVFAGGGDKIMRLVVLSLAFLLVSLPCMTLWALLGVGSARAFGSPQAFKRMNHALAFLLLVSAWLTVLV